MREIETPALELSSSEEAKADPADTILPIHVDDAQYLQLTRALRPVAPVLNDFPAVVPKLDAPAGAGEASSPITANSRAAAAEQPPGTPIV